ncbi:hypothetical protein [Blastococcus sp. KM273129]|uniref:hypothetical protein n=1 Tax=Blastococcus sp. KM273129 TaxID=2570315 RepID=UPI001F2426FF|nr:hypothetical protein [Blastococcus sp. KM273129]MCF6736925.1 hypothetical protein [Blastococcus sp. KM273129]
MSIRRRSSPVVTGKANLGRMGNGHRWRAGSSAAAMVAVLITLGACAPGAAGGGAVGTPGAGEDAAGTTVPGQGAGRAGTPTQSSEPAVHPVTTVVISGDPAVATAVASAEGAWPTVLAERLGQAGAPIAVTTAGEGGGAFVPDHPAASSFVDLVRAEVQHSTQLVVFHDTSTEEAAAGAIEEAAAAAFKATEEAAPDARIVLIVTATESDTREALASAARGAELPVTLVDAVSDGWPASPDQEEFADRLAPHVVELVGALARSGAFE